MAAPPEQRDPGFVVQHAPQYGDPDYGMAPQQALTPSMPTAPAGPLSTFGGGGAYAGFGPDSGVGPEAGRKLLRTRSTFMVLLLHVITFTLYGHFYYYIAFRDLENMYKKGPGSQTYIIVFVLSLLSAGIMGLLLLVMQAMTPKWISEAYKEDKGNSDPPVGAATAGWAIGGMILSAILGAIGIILFFVDLFGDIPIWVRPSIFLGSVVALALGWTIFIVKVNRALNGLWRSEGIK